MPVPLRHRVEHVDDSTERILDHRLAARPPGQRSVALQLHARQALVVDAGEADDLRRRPGPAGRTAAPPDRSRAPRGAAASSAARLLGIGLAGDVDEASASDRRAAGRASPRPRRASACGRGGHPPRVDDLARVRVHRCRLLADRELDTGAVEDRARDLRDTSASRCCWLAPLTASLLARTVCSQAARASVTAKTIAKTTSRIRIRRSASRLLGRLRRTVSVTGRTVDVVAGRPASRPRAPSMIRAVRFVLASFAVGGDVRLQLRALAVDAVETAG